MLGTAHLRNIRSYPKVFNIYSKRNTNNYKTFHEHTSKYPYIL